MSTKYDGKTRPSNDIYRNNFNDIFGKKKVDKDNRKNRLKEETKKKERE